MKSLIDKLAERRLLDKKEFMALLDNRTPEITQYALEKADEVRRRYYQNHVYLRGLIEFSNYCRNDCYYCGIRCGNKAVERYRLSKEDILACCQTGYGLGYRTFVLQSGEDPYFTDDKLVDIITAIRTAYPSCAITLSLGERSYESYQKLREAGADRYLLRIETSGQAHYERLHPAGMSFENRKQCLDHLKALGFAVGTGFMVGSPYQTNEQLADDLLFLYELQPEMVGIGPFIPHHDTPFAHFAGGTLEDTVFLLSLIRLMLPTVLLPATTALGTISPKGREQGILAGANVVMPNLSPVSVRDKYTLYDNKICTGDEAAECRGCIERRINSIGYQIVIDRGDQAAIQA